LQNYALQALNHYKTHDLILIKPGNTAAHATSETSSAEGNPLNRLSEYSSELRDRSRFMRPA